MSFRWVDDAGKARSPDFQSRQQAEDWMGREWEVLLDEGLEAATLYDGDTKLYRMKLTAE